MNNDLKPSTVLLDAYIVSNFTEGRPKLMINKNKVMLIPELRDAKKAKHRIFVPNFFLLF